MQSLGGLTVQIVNHFVRTSIMAVILFLGPFLEEAILELHLPVMLACFSVVVVVEDYIFFAYRVLDKNVVVIK